MTKGKLMIEDPNRTPNLSRTDRLIAVTPATFRASGAELQMRF